MNNMIYMFLLIAFIVLFVDSLVIYYVKQYNKLTKKKNELQQNYLALSTEVQYRFKLTQSYIPILQNLVDANTISYLNKIINDFYLESSVDQIANSYYLLNSELLQIDNVTKQMGYSYPEWEKAFNDSLGRIEACRLLYDDNVLKMNNMVDMAPSNIVAKIAGFSKWSYFRNA